MEDYRSSSDAASFERSRIKRYLLLIVVASFASYCVGRIVAALLGVAAVELGWFRGFSIESFLGFGFAYAGGLAAAEYGGRLRFVGLPAPARQRACLLVAFLSWIHLTMWISIAGVGAYGGSWIVPVADCVVVLACCIWIYRSFDKRQKARVNQAVVK